MSQDPPNRLQLEAALRENEKRCQLLFEMSGDAILLTQGDDPCTLTANPAACLMFGYSREEFCAVPLDHLAVIGHPQWPPLLAEGTQDGRAGGRVDFVRRNGDRFPADFNAAVLHDSNGRLRAVVHIRDVSERKAAETGLRESEMRWRFAVESQGDAMWDWDADRDALFLTAAAKDLFSLPDAGYTRPIADLLGRVVEEDRGLIERQIGDLLSGKSSEWLGEWRLSAPAASRWVATRGRVMTVGAGGRPHRIVSISRDVTQQKRGLAEARRQGELVAHQARLVLLGELASALAHEISQPLTAITGFAAACARKIAEPPEALELVQAIEVQAMRAGEIALRMRGFARRQRLGRRALSLHDVVAGVAKWMSLDSPPLDVVSDITGVAPDLPLVHADRVELEQVLVNLVRNGIEAGRPNVTVQRIAITGAPGEHPGEIEVRVIDWGRGLPPTADLDAFQPFISSKEQGLGLGLSICYSIIEGLGGNLWATANPEGGTIFHFTLPVAEGARLPHQAENSAAEAMLSGAVP